MEGVKIMHKSFLTAVLLAVSVLSLNAQSTWKIDAGHSNVIFTVSHMVISEVTGRFNEFDATLVQTGNDLTGSKLNAKIKASSIITDNEGRDKHLRSADFFDVDKYPEITFVSKSFEKVSENKYKITGDLTMHGVTKTVILDTKFNGQMNDPWGNTKAGFKATTEVNRKDFGLVWNKTLETGGVLVGESVGITINAEMNKEKK
jgi:polyisoprenoid-binding protein YceI